MNRDEMLLNKRARERALGRERRDARRHKDARTVPGYTPINLNPHEMLPRERAYPSLEERRILRAWENTGGRGETVEWVRAKDCGCKPGRDEHGKRRMCTHGRTRRRTMAPSRKKYDGRTHVVGPVVAGDGTGDRPDNVSRAERERAYLSYTDLVQHGLVVES